MADDDAMTPEELLGRLVGLFPDFAEYWNGPDNDERKVERQDSERHVRYLIHVDRYAHDLIAVK